MTNIVNQEKESLYQNTIEFLKSLKEQPYFIAEESWFFRYDIYFDRENDVQIHLFDSERLSKDPVFLSILNSNDPELKDKLFVHLDLIERSNKELDKYILDNNKEQEENNETPTPLIDSSNSLKLTTLLNYSKEDAKRAYSFYFKQLLKGIQESSHDNYMYFDSVELIRNPYFSQAEALNFKEYKEFIKSADKFQKDVFVSYLFLAHAKVLIQDTKYSITDIFDVFVKYTNNDYTYQNMRLMDIYRIPFSLSTAEYILQLDKKYVQDYEYPSEFSSKDEFVSSLLEDWDICLSKYNYAKNLVNF